MWICQLASAPGLREVGGGGGAEPPPRPRSFPSMGDRQRRVRIGRRGGGCWRRIIDDPFVSLPQRIFELIASFSWEQECLHRSNRERERFRSARFCLRRRRGSHDFQTGEVFFKKKKKKSPDEATEKQQRNSNKN